MMWTLHDGLYVEGDAPGEEPVTEFNIWPLVPLYPMTWHDEPPILIVDKPTTDPNDPTKPGKTWIEIRLVSDAGDPIPNERFILHMPDGQKKEDQLDGKGWVRFDNIDPGPYTVSFPDIGYTQKIS